MSIIAGDASWSEGDSTRYDVPIERGKVREFAAGAQSTNSAYSEPRPVIPPTFLTIAQNFWATSEARNVVADLGLRRERVLHGEEEYEFFGELPRAGETLHATTSIGDRWEKQGKRGGQMRFVKIITQFRDADWRLVAEQRSTAIETAQHRGEER